MEVGFTPTAMKEPTVKNRAYAVVLAAVVALLAASGASAKATAVHQDMKVAKLSLAKPNHKVNQTAAHRSICRRMVRGL